MVNSNANALGIIFPNSYDSLVPELANIRLMASIPFASRYRLVDFVLSSMANSGISNVSLIVRQNYYSLMDHLGSGREWDLSRKKGGLNIVPPFAEKNMKVYNGRVDGLASILTFLKSQKEKYVILADANLAANFDFKDFINVHAASGADLTAAYTVQEIPEDLKKLGTPPKAVYYTFDLDEDKVTGIKINYQKDKIQNFGMNYYIMDRELLIEQVHTAYVRGYSDFERDILLPQLPSLDVRAYRYDGYVSRITSLKSYYDENMKMLDPANMDALFSGHKIYTKIRDDNPTRYVAGSRVRNIMAADGCVIEGEAENSILFRGVKIARGAKVKNCILMQDTVVEPGADVEYVISDKNVVFTSFQKLKGSPSFPVYVAKHQRV